jgi:xanthine dehydrogenase accessory factor
LEFLEQLNTAYSSGKAFAMAVITAADGTTPRHPGTKMIIYEDGTPAGTIGGGDIEQEVIANALRCLTEKKTLLKTYPVIQSDGKQSGSETIYIEPAFPRAHLILCGAGHVAGKLIAPAKSVGFRVTVIDIRDEAMVRERAAAADEFISAGSWQEGLNRISENDNQYLIACAFNFEQDEEILSHLIRRKGAYIGMLASQYKRETIYNHLRQRGIPEESLARVHSPIGLPIGAETPEEIAISIAAELIRVRSLNMGKDRN